MNKHKSRFTLITDGIWSLLSKKLFCNQNTFNNKITTMTSTTDKKIKQRVQGATELQETGTFERFGSTVLGTIRRFQDPFGSNVAQKPIARNIL